MSYLKSRRLGPNFNNFIQQNVSNLGQNVKNLGRYLEHYKFGFYRNVEHFGKNLTL